MFPLDGVPNRNKMDGDEDRRIGQRLSKKIAQGQVGNKQSSGDELESNLVE